MIIMIILIMIILIITLVKGDMDSKRVLAFFRLQVGQSEVPFLKT